MKSRIVAILALATLFMSAGHFASADTIEDQEAQELQAQQQAMIDEANAELIQPDKGAKSTSGDRIMAPYGTYPTRAGVILVTSDFFKGLIPTGHAGIVYDSSSTIESVGNGVSVLKNNWHSTKNQAWGVTVNGLSDASDAQAAQWARNQVGKPYNYNYFNVNTRSKFYCSQLVWAAFKDNFGIDLNTWFAGSAIHPMELVATDKTYMVWRKS